MKKILIYKKSSELVATGGPAGYLYNLREGLNKYSDLDIQIDFIKDENIRKNTRIKKRTGVKIIDDIMGGIYHRISYKRLLDDKFKHTGEEELINKYDIIHFHSPYGMYSVRDTISNYEGKILLTCHTPVPFYQEVISKFTKIDKLLMGKYISQISKIDQFAFERADCLVFPCKYSDESYLKLWPSYKYIKKNKEYRYILTGIKKCDYGVEKNIIRKKYGIPEEAFVFCYVGRHNEVKGYDDLKEFAAEILKKHENVWFLIAGKEEPLTRLNNKHWIEAGWTNDPHSIINAGDVFVLPNKDTYFDLVMLEVLSLEKPVLASYTGGNKFFRDINAEGVLLYNNLEEAICIGEELISMSNKKLLELGKKNFLIFEKEFTLEKFTNSYISLYRSL